MPNTLNWPAYVNKRISKSIGAVIKEAHEEGDLPEDLLQWVDKDPEDLPSIRSVVTAPDGMVFVESDYSAAESFALAIISGDADLMRILYEPDPDWAYLNSDNPYGASSVRVGFSEKSPVPVEARDPDFIMNVWKDGEKLGPVTEDMLARDSLGNLKKAKYDTHWSLAEATFDKGREMMNEKVQRTGAKAIGFCVAEDSEVLTRDRGVVALQSVSLDDLLWDGVEWVSHGGVVNTGVKEIIKYQGLRATRLHEVWTEEIGKCRLEEACARSLTLVRSAGPLSILPDVSRNSKKAQVVGRGDLDAACRAFICGKAQTYDILDAGPRHRFTCSGVLVSNSAAYGASAGSIERKIESDTGIKPEPGTGDKGLDMIEARQPRATEFMQEMAAIPKTHGMYRAKSGRIRHCLTHSAGSGVNWRVRNSLESSMGRELRNYPLQESVGATAARACRMLGEAYRRLGLQARGMTCLYDSVVTMCPPEERFLVARLHQVYMCDHNTWDYDGRLLKFSIDTDIVYKWSTPPKGAEKKELESRDYRPASAKHNMLENCADITMFAGR